MQTVSDDAIHQARAARGAAFQRLFLGARRGVVPAECACCGALAVSTQAISDGVEQHLLIGYCDECAAHVARHATRRYAALFGGALLAACLAAGLPVAMPAWPMAVDAALAALGALAVPLLAGALERVPRGHAAAGPSVLFGKPGELWSRRRDWAERFAEGLALDSGPEPVSAGRRLSMASLPLALGAALLAFALHRFHHPPLRVLNLGDGTLVLTVDGRFAGRVEPTSGESSRAGLEVRVPSGRRFLEARDTSGNLLASASVQIASGRHHLYAPGSVETCFWLESRSYGKEQSQNQGPERPERPGRPGRPGRPRLGAETIVPLEGADRFWVLPDNLRGWFSPNPRDSSGANLTGGTSVALRQAPCSEAPLEAGGAR